ncbi:hypothetical protein GUJ93_ZPchr0009g1246 [Zizania palustris]|uniref:Uncharacterized protein n=1 Tax=Zizania palustris TaxID=103762 RepID=A0A8J5S452_ZIZPA|nr:hypothetical protein GUJ93_ZPchr0009g1246 [Zizania palustris]
MPSSGGGGMAADDSFFQPARAPIFPRTSPPRALGFAPPPPRLPSPRPRFCAAASAPPLPASPPPGRRLRAFRPPPPRLPSPRPRFCVAASAPLPSPLPRLPAAARRQPPPPSGHRLRKPCTAAPSVAGLHPPLRLGLAGSNMARLTSELLRPLDAAQAIDEAALLCYAAAHVAGFPSPALGFVLT